MFDDGTEMTFFAWNVAQNQPDNIPSDVYLYLREQHNTLMFVLLLPDKC
jgi:hypothetical protein